MKNSELEEFNMNLYPENTNIDGDQAGDGEDMEDGDDDGPGDKGSMGGDKDKERDDEG